MNTFQIPEAILPALHPSMEGVPIFDNHVDDEHLCAIVRDARADLWATARGAKCMAQPILGTRPGVPMSDITFS